MIILGSTGVLQARYRSSGEGDVLLLDISNDAEYIWTTSFDPTPFTTDSQSPNLPLKSKNIPNKILLAGLIVGIIVFIIILSLGAFFFMRRHKNHKNTNPNEDIMLIPSDNELSLGKTKI
jgi:hypothetical protein